MRRRTALVCGAALLAVAGLVVGAVFAFPRGPEARATARTVEFPQELEQLVFTMCVPPLPADLSDGGQGFVFGLAGSGPSFSVRMESQGDWTVVVDRHGVTLQNERSDAEASQMASQAGEAVPSAVSLYNCLSDYRFAQHETRPPTSSSDLLQLYRYDNNVLWPCLISHGIKMGDPPSRDQFVSSFSALTADPISAMTPTRTMLPRLAVALQACPLRPAYLH